MRTVVACWSQVGGVTFPGRLMLGSLTAREFRRVATDVDVEVTVERDIELTRGVEERGVSSSAIISPSVRLGKK